MNICDNCGNEHDGEYGSGRFCSIKCSRGFSTKAKRKEINAKVSSSLIKEPYIKKCPFCKLEFKTKIKNRIFCSVKCSSNERSKDEEYINKLSINSKKRCSSLKERKRMRDIGRKGGFGKKGKTINGTNYDSLIEKSIFEYLESKEVRFISHKPIPNSSKISDVYLVDQDLWIEIDGINREKNKAWLGKQYDYWLEKLDIYKKEKLNFNIVYNLDEFKQII